MEKFTCGRNVVDFPYAIDYSVENDPAHRFVAKKYFDHNKSIQNQIYRCEDMCIVHIYVICEKSQHLQFVIAY